MQNPGKDNKFRNLYFQEKWYKDYPWLHYYKDVNVLLCYICYILILKVLIKEYNVLFLLDSKIGNKLLKNLTIITNHVPIWIYIPYQYILIILNVF